MNRMAFSVLLLSVALCCRGLASEACTNEWYTGTLVTITTPGEEPLVVTNTFLQPGLGSNFLTCFDAPGNCSVLTCNADPSASFSGYSCIGAPIGSCISALVTTCPDGTPVITRLESYIRPASGPCPAL